MIYETKIKQGTRRVVTTDINVILSHREFDDEETIWIVVWTNDGEVSHSLEVKKHLS